MMLSPIDYVENVQCTNVTVNDIENLEGFSDYIKEMIKFCVDKRGVGLAAPQIGLPKRFFISFDINRDKWSLYVNPRYDPIGNEMVEGVEACLTYGNENKYTVMRYDKIIATWEVLNVSERMLIEVSKLLSRPPSIIFQHETDHCNGITIAMIGKKVNGL